MLLPNNNPQSPIETKKGKGRPPKEVNWDLFRSLCEIHCTCEEIAGVLDIDQNTLEVKIKEKFGQSFSPIFKKFAAGGKMSLRRSQFKLAHRNPTMSIWLGKNYLDQKDSPTETQANEEMIKYYELMIEQLRNLQLSSSKSSAAVNIASQDSVEIS